MSRVSRFGACALVASLSVVAIIQAGQRTVAPQGRAPAFHTSDRCIACHNGLVTSSGADVSIGFDWRASIMANSARDPYWQAAVRRETIDHPKAAADIEDNCATCHMPASRYEARLRDRRGDVFSHLPFAGTNQPNVAEDGVTCSVCHQIGRERLGTPESFSGGFVIDPPDAQGNRMEYGPFEVDPGHRLIMLSSTEGYRPVQSAHISQSEMCATCHTLITEPLGPDGTTIGTFPEQVPFQEWMHSEYRNTRSCQACHMPVVQEPAPITRVFGTPRTGVAQHTFVAANFFVLRMLNRYRADLGVMALPQELNAAADKTLRYLGSEAARMSIADAEVEGGRLRADVSVENLGGHKLPTAYPSRRAWVHLAVRDRAGRVVFESGALNADASIQGNDNDVDPLAFEPHFTEIRGADQVQIYESILGDTNGVVTTGLLSAATYLKDNRLLPHGFDKRTAPPDIAVVGDALADPNFTGAGDRVRYFVPINEADGPFQVEAELLYQPIGYRWANNLEAYKAAEPQRFNHYYDAMAASATATLARAEVSIPPRPRGY